MKTAAIERHDGGIPTHIGKNEVLGGISLRRLNRLLKPFGYRVFFEFEFGRDRRTLVWVSPTWGMDLCIPLRAVNRLLRPFGVTFSVLRPDCCLELPVVYLCRGKYPL